MKKFLATILVIAVLAVVAGPWLLTQLGRFLVVDSPAPAQADAVVVLSTGVDYLPRLMQAADLYSRGTVSHVVINGNRKTDVHRELERQGYRSPRQWHEGSVSVLEFLGVPGERVVTVSAEDAYDTVSEAQYVGPALATHNISSIIVTTSKFHTRRANAIWQHLYGDQLDIQIAAAADDPFAVDGWWHHGRQIRQLMAEYGAWLFFWGKQIRGE